MAGPFPKQKEKNPYQGGPGPGLDLGRGVDLGFFLYTWGQGVYFFRVGGRGGEGGKYIGPLLWVPSTSLEFL